MIERPDVMTMVVYATKKEDACLAIMRCVPDLPRDSGVRPQQLMQEALAQYCPEFETERASSPTERQIPFQGDSETAKITSAYRTDDHQEVRVVNLEERSNEKGAVALYFQTSVDSSTDDEIDNLLNSLK
jgi:hypothetical protein